MSVDIVIFLLRIQLLDSIFIYSGYFIRLSQEDGVFLEDKEQIMEFFIFSDKEEFFVSILVISSYVDFCIFVGFR